MNQTTTQRISLSVYFFLIGFVFATWASRIPSIKINFDFNEAELGNLLLIMPISSLVGLPISGWLLSKYNSRVPLLVSFIVLLFSLFEIGKAETLIDLIIGVAVFAFCIRIANIAANTMSLSLQKMQEKKIIGAFHGLWSLGGLLGALFSTLMVSANILMKDHFLYVFIMSLVLGVGAFPFLMKNDKSASGNKLILGKPDKYILYLGLMVFFGALCEGGMFDWSGVYFNEVVGEEVFTVGYLIFMTFMALSRFYSDKLSDQIGMKNTYLLGAAIVTLGMLLVIIFPSYWPVLIGFSLVGIGVASVFPMTFSLAGNSKKYSPGMAISIISTYGIIGMLIGPPLVGYLAHLIGLRYAFTLFILFGLMLIPLSHMFFRLKND